MGEFGKTLVWGCKAGVCRVLFGGCCSLVGRMIVVTAREAARAVTHELHGMRAHVQSPKTQAPVYLGQLPRVDRQLHECSCTSMLEC